VAVKLTDPPGETDVGLAIAVTASAAGVPVTLVTCVAVTDVPATPPEAVVAIVSLFVKTPPKWYVLETGAVWLGVDAIAAAGLVQTSV